MDKNELVTVNMTFKVQRKNVTGIENYFIVSDLTTLTDFRIIPNTDHLKEDKRFIKLNNEAKKAKEAKYDYINKNAN